MKKLKELSRPSHLVLTVALLTISIPMVFQNCGDGFQTKRRDWASIGYGGVYRDDCLKQSGFDACIYFKNPVAQKGEPVASDEMASLQIMGVQLEGLNGSGYLQNASFEVLSHKHGRAQKGQDDWRFPYGQAGSEGLPQIMTYFWAQVAVQEMEKALDGPTVLAGKNLRIVTDAPYTGLSIAENKIYLGEGNNQVDSAAWSGGVVAHLLMESHIYYSSAGAAYDLTGDTKHQDCGPADGPVYQLDCCVSDKGCSRAITAGLADFWVARMFPTNPTLGENLNQNVNGLNHCGLSRNVEFFKNMTAAASYGSCAQNGYPGQIYTMGTLMASIWFEIWKEAGGKDQTLEIETLFFEAQKYVNGQDDFISFLATIKQADSRLFSGKWSSRFEEEYRRRGLLN